MKPPTADAVTHASQILQDSVHEQNGTRSISDDPFATYSASALDVHIRAFETAAAAFCAQTQLQIAALKRHKNTLSPISKVPFEILARVLLASLDPTTVSPHDLRRLAQVSKYWLDVVKADPRFWTRIDFNSSAPTMHMFLRKSKGVPLRIDCISDDKVLVSRMEDFMEAVGKHSDRWGSLKYQGTATPRLLRLLSESKPMLQDIRVRFHWHYQQSWLFALPKDASLRHVSLSSASLDWDAETSSLQKLKSLELRDLHVNPPTTSHLLAILAASPDLESLTLVNIAPATGDVFVLEDWNSAEHHVALDRLESLHLSNVPSNVCGALLSRIDAPNCRRVVADKVPDRLFSDSQTEAPPLLNLLRPILRTAASVNLTLEGRLDLLSLSTSSSLSKSDPLDSVPMLDIKLESNTDHEDVGRQLLCLGRFLSSADSAAKVELKVGKTWWWNDDHELFHLPPLVLETLGEALTDLEIGNGVDGADALQFLANPCREPDHEASIVSWPCPNLVNVTLKPWEGNADSVVQFLSWRWFDEGRHSVPIGGEVRRPAKLQRLMVPTDLPASVMDVVKRHYSSVLVKEPSYYYGGI